MPEMYYGFNIAIVLSGLFMWVILNIVLNNHLIALSVPIPHPSQNNVYFFNVVFVSVLFENMFLPDKQ